MMKLLAFTLAVFSISLPSQGHSKAAIERTVDSFDCEFNEGYALGVFRREGVEEGNGKFSFTPFQLKVRNGVNSDTEDWRAEFSFHHNWYKIADTELIRTYASDGGGIITISDDDGLILAASYQFTSLAGGWAYNYVGKCVER